MFDYSKTKVTEAIIILHRFTHVVIS